MELRIRNFILMGSVAKKKLIIVSWDSCCYPKKVGGLGIRSLHVLNEALLFKLAVFVHSAKEGVLFF